MLFLDPFCELDIVEFGVELPDLDPLACWLPIFANNLFQYHILIFTNGEWQYPDRYCKTFLSALWKILADVVMRHSTFVNCHL